MTKINIFSGFLGAGKTTLIKKLINEVYKGEKVVLIENEFGEIGIDGGFLKEADIEITEMNSGCICCSLVGDFTESLKKVLNQFEPDRILIEPSGVGKLSDVIRAIQNVNDNNVVLESFTTVVDAKKCKIYMKNFGEFYNDQIESASCIILSHTDGMEETKISNCISLIREKNEKAVIVSTPWNDLDGNQILTAMQGSDSLENKLTELIEETNVCPECGHHHEHHHGEECECGHHHEHHHTEECECGHHHEHHHGEDCECGHHHEHHHADDVFESWGTETTRSYSKEEIEDALAKIEDCEIFGTVLRAKGIVASCDGKWIHFDYIPGEADVRFGPADIIGRICVIGSAINKSEIEKVFFASK